MKLFKTKYLYSMLLILIRCSSPTNILQETLRIHLGLYTFFHNSVKFAVMQVIFSLQANLLRLQRGGGGRKSMKQIISKEAVTLSPFN